MSSVLLLGATSYIGGSVLVTLHEKHPELKITALVEDADLLDAVRAAGATPVQGSHDELEKIEALSTQVDIVINTADHHDADNLNLAKSILSGIKAHFTAGKGKGIYIHTSGTANFIAGNADGSPVKDPKIWDDSSEDDIKNITTSMVHGPVDVHLLNAGKEDFVNVYIICPGIVYGPGFGPGEKQTIFSNLVFPPAVQRKAATYVGDGSNTIEGVHINDLVDLYDRVFNLAVSGKDKGGPYGRYYIASITRATWKEVAEEVGNVLYAKAVATSPEPQSIPFEEAGEWAFILAGSCSSRSVRGRQLGWNPKETGPFKNTIKSEGDFFFAHNPIQ